MKKNVFAAMLVAIGVLLSHLVYIPIGPAKCFPIQHAINVVGAVFLGPLYAVAVAFAISILRNLMGVGTLLAFPGSMIGALLAGLFFRAFKRDFAAALGEVIGTGLIGGLLAVPVANLLMGTEKGAFVLIIPFAMSSLCGSAIAVLVLKSRALKKTAVKHLGEEKTCAR